MLEEHIFNDLDFGGISVNITLQVYKKSRGTLYNERSGIRCKSLLEPVFREKPQEKSLMSSCSGKVSLISCNYLLYSCLLFVAESLGRIDAMNLQDLNVIVKVR